MSSKTDKTPCIYVADLAAYNAGHLHGVWIECCPADADGWQSQIDAMIASSPVEDAEEWQIHTYENWHGIDPSDYDLETLAEIVEAMEENEPVAVAAWIANCGTGFDLDNFADEYRGVFDSEEAFVEEQLSESGIMAQLEKIMISPCTADVYLDTKRIANDWFIDSYWSHQESHNQVHVFVRC